MHSNFEFYKKNLSYKTYKSIKHFEEIIINVCTEKILNIKTEIITLQLKKSLDHYWVKEWINKNQSTTGLQFDFQMTKFERNLYNNIKIFQNLLKFSPGCLEMHNG